MSDNSQTTQFPQGINTPSLSGVSTISFNDGLVINSTPTPVSLALGGANVGTFTHAIVTGNAINGTYQIKASMGGALSLVNLEIAVQSFVGATSVTNQVTVTSVSDSDKSVLCFKYASVQKNTINNEMAVLLSYTCNSPGSTNMSVNVDSIGNPATMNVTTTIAPWNTSVSYRYVDSRDMMLALSQRVNGSVISLNSITVPSTVSCNPADVPSRPTGSNGYGSCITISGGDTKLQLSQIFHDTQTGRMWSRFMTGDGVTWSAWNNMITQADISDTLAKSAQATIMDSIIFG
jgi:hypothetical protein